MGGIDAMLADLRRLGGDDVGAQVAREAAPRIEAALKASAAAGQTPEGQAWPPVKDGGGRAMVNAAAHVAAKAIGAVVRVTLTGPDVYHQFSKKTSEPRRRVIPDVGGAIPPAIARALDEAAAAVWRRFTGGT